MCPQLAVLKTIVTVSVPSGILSKIGVTIRRTESAVVGI
jgi:hypothetical protein